MERDAQNCNYLPWQCHFNSHAHVERDIMVKDYQGNYADFNSHAHVERDLNKKSAERGNKKFQLTRSRGA